MLPNSVQLDFALGIVTRKGGDYRLRERSEYSPTRHGPYRDSIATAWLQNDRLQGDRWGQAGERLYFVFFTPTFTPTNTPTNVFLS